MRNIFIWAVLLFGWGGSSLFFAAPSARAAEKELQHNFSQEALHVHAEKLWFETEPQFWRLQDRVKVFWGDYRLSAHDVRWLPRHTLLFAQGQVALQAPEWVLEAQSLNWQPQHIQAQQLTFTYRGLFFQAQSLSMQSELWRFQDVELSLSESPFVLRAKELWVQPQAEKLILQGVYWPGSTLPGLNLELDFPRQGESLSLRNPLSVFQPELGWQAGQLQLGFQSQLWQNKDSQGYLQSSWQAQQGWRGQLGFEWHPEADWRWNTRFSYAQAVSLEQMLDQGLTQGYVGRGFQGRSELLWRFPIETFSGLSENTVQPWLRLRLDWQEPESFWQEFWLPPLLSLPLQQSGAQLWWGSRYALFSGQQEGPGRFVLAYRWPQNEGGMTWVQELELWRFNVQSSLRASWLLNGLYSGRWHWTGGAKILQQNQWALSEGLDLSSQMTLEQGNYLEYYYSQLDAGRFLQPYRLEPWCGTYALWHINAHWGLGADLAWSLQSGQWSKADLLVSWHLRPLYAHLLLRALPLGVSLQTRFEWF